MLYILTHGYCETSTHGHVLRKPLKALSNTGCIFFHDKHSVIVHNMLISRYIKLYMSTVATLYLRTHAFLT